MFAGALGACREKAVPLTVEKPSWNALTGSWTGTEGGGVTEENGVLHMAFGEMLTAAKWTGVVPEAPFELEYEARRVDGSDFFGAVTFPARKDEFVTFVLGGWGGGLVGISSIDHMDASENETGTNMKFETGKWYRIRLLVTAVKIEAWIDDQKVVDVSIEGKTLSLRPGPITACMPFGFGTWQSTGEVRGARWRKI